MKKLGSMIPMIANDFFRESPRVSPCNCFDLSLVAFGGVFLFSDFLILGFEIRR